MARRHGYRVAFDDPQLERRELLSRDGLAPVPALVGSASPAPHPAGFDVFHHDGINGLILHQHFVDRLNDRLQTSSDQAARVLQAFLVFETSYSQLPVNPPSGYSGPTATSLLTDLRTQVDYALSHHEILTNRPRPSQRKGPKVSPLAPRALIPYVDAQIGQLGATLSTTPPVPGPDGRLVTANPIPAINEAINASFNALAETSIHPNLFRSPSDFYISPDIQFDLNSTGAPARSSPGYFIRGPHGAILPGANLHPHVPL
jgi:hypothetical protein